MPNTTNHTALLVMDVQPGIIERVPDRDAFLARTAETMAHARRAGIRDERGWRLAVGGRRRRMADGG